MRLTWDAMSQCFQRFAGPPNAPNSASKNAPRSAFAKGNGLCLGRRAWCSGAGLTLVPKVTGSEDFSFFQRVVPGLFIFLGVTPPGADPKTAAPNHSPRFYADEAGLLLGVRALSHLACDYPEAPAG